MLRRLLNDPLNRTARYATEVMAAKSFYYLPELASREDRIRSRSMRGLKARSGCRTCRDFRAVPVAN